MRPMRSLTVLGLLGSCAALVVNFPLKWVVKLGGPSETVNYFTPYGTIWNGFIRPDIAGDLVLKTRVRGGYLRLDNYGGSTDVSAIIRPRSLSDLEAAFPLRDLANYDARFANVAGRLAINIDTLTFSKGWAECEDVSGDFTSDVLQQASIQFGLAPWPELSGPITCENGDLVANFTSKADGDELSANLVFDLSGQYNANIKVNTYRRDAGPVLQMYGFENRQGEYVLIEQGQWR